MAAGHEVHLITSRRAGQVGAEDDQWTTSVEAGIQVHWCSVPYSNEMSFLRRIAAFVRFAVAAARRSVGIGGDVIFATSTPLTIALPAIYAHWRLHKPFVFEVRDLWPEVPIALGVIRNPVLIGAARALESAAYRYACQIVALSPPMRDGIVARGVPANRVTVVPNGADINVFEPSRNLGQVVRTSHPWLGDRPLVLYAGTLGFANGIDYLVRLAASIRPHAPETRFAVIGDGAERGAIETLARSHGVLEETLFLLPPVSKTEIVRWFSAADVVTSFVIDVPAMHANSANKFFDGLAAGRPLAINHEGWQADILRTEGAGIVLPPRNAAKGAEVLLGFLNSEEHLRDAGLQARRVAEERFSRDVLAAQLLQVIVTAVGS